MTYLDLTLPTPEENLACDEALLDRVETLRTPGVLRLWESPRHFVVLGYGNKIRQEADLEACRAQGVPVLRRCSGGGAVLQGPGCLNYALVLPITMGLPLQSVTSTNRFIMEQHRALFAQWLGQQVNVEGVTDLALGGRKFSGNAQRRRHRAVLFHGTFLCEFDAERMKQFLLHPARQPSYRAQRSHADFLAPLPLPAAEIRTRLRQLWQADQPHPEVPAQGIAQLVAQKYGRAEWNWRW